MPSAPLLSVVIPTYRRPHLLPRAIASALQTTPGGNVEVIVVPNGPDESWRTVAEDYRSNRHVQWHAIATAHANAARNHGLRLARGKYIRFLDDDDYLLASASEQLALIERTGADVCSGLLLNVDEEGAEHGIVRFPETRDFVCAAVDISGFTLPVGNLFRSDKLRDCTWDICVPRRQDNAWMIDLAAQGEWHWVHIEATVGVWFQHRAARVSCVDPPYHRNEPLIDRLVGLFLALAAQNRLNETRRTSIADSLWAFAHSGFVYHPLYWSRVMREARRIAPTSRPRDAAYESGMFSVLNPLIVEWSGYPHRRIRQFWRDCRQSMQGIDYRRRL